MGSKPEGAVDTVALWPVTDNIMLSACSPTFSSKRSHPAPLFSLSLLLNLKMLPLLYYPPTFEGPPCTF